MGAEEVKIYVSIIFINFTKSYLALSLLEMTVNYFIKVGLSFVGINF